MFRELQKHVKNKSKVISLRYGLGEISGLLSMYDGLDDYLKIVYVIEDQPKLVCIKHKSDVRLLSSRESIESALKFMNRSLNDESIKSDFCELQGSFFRKDVNFIVNRIVDFLRKETLSDKENVLLSLTIDSLISEVEEVFSVNNDMARGIVSDYLKCA